METPQVNINVHVHSQPLDKLRDVMLKQKFKKRPPVSAGNPGNDMASQLLKKLNSLSSSNHPGGV